MSRTAEVIFVGTAASIVKAAKEAEAATAAAASGIATSNGRIADAYGRMVLAADTAGKVAAKQAAAIGASLDGQSLAYQHAAERIGLSNDSIAASAKAAGEAAARQTSIVGGSLKEQQAAYARAAEAAGASAKAQEAAAAKAAAAAEAAAAKTAAAHEKMAASAKKSNEAFAKWGTAAAVGVIAGAVDMAIKVESAATAIAKAGGTSTAAGKKIEDAFRTIPGTVEYSARKIGESFATVAGELKVVEGHALTAAEAMKVMKAALDLADASGNSLKSSTEALGKVMMTFHLGAKDAAGAADVLFNASKVTGISIEDFTTLVDKARGRLGALAPSLAETAGLMAELAKQGVSGRLTMGALGGAFGTLLSQSKKVNDQLKELHVHVFDSQGRFVGLKSVIEQLHPVLSRYNEAAQLQITRTLFGEKANKQLLEVIHQGPAAFNAATASVSRHGAAAAAAAQQHQTLEGRLKAAKATAENMAATLGERFIPILGKVVTALSDVIKWFDKHKTAAKALEVVITTILGAALVDFAVVKVAKFVGGIKTMVDGLKLLAAKFTATTATVVAEDGVMVTTTEAAAVSITAALGATGIGLAVAALAVLIVKFNVTWGKVWKGIEEGAQAAGNGIIDTLNTIIDKINEFTHRISFGLIPAIEHIQHLSGAGGSLSGVQGFLEAHPNRQPLEGEAAEAAGSHGQRGVVGAAAKKFRVSAQALWGIYGTETNFGKDINTSSAGAVGAFQFTEKAKMEKYGYPNTNHPNAKQFAQQAEAAAHYFHDLLKEKHGDLNAAISAYNAGPAGSYQGGYVQKTQENARQYGTQTVPGTESAGAKHAATIRAAARRAEEAYADPFLGASGVHRSRTDQGVDFSFGGKLGAIGPGIIEKVKNFQAFGETIVELLTSGSHKGQRIYTGLETGGRGLVHAGQRVRAGQAIATGYGSGGIEMGFAGPEGLPVTRYAPGASHGQPTVGGEAFSKFLGSIGKGGGALQLASATFSNEAKAIAAAAKVALAKQTADKQVGESQFQKIASAIQSGGVKELTEVTKGVHGTWLRKLVEKLASDGSAANQTLAAKLVAAHTVALQALHTALVTRWNDAITSLKQLAPTIANAVEHALPEFAKSAAGIWQTRSHEAIAKGPNAQAIIAERKAEEDEQTKETEAANAKALVEAKKALKEAKGEGNKENIKKAEEGVKQSEANITKFARQQDIKRREAQEAEDNAAVDSGVTAYEEGLNKQTDALAANLRHAKITWATFAAEVKALFAPFGLGFTVDPGTLGILGAGSPTYKNEQGLGVAPPEWPGMNKHPAQEEHERNHPKRAAGGPVYPGVTYEVGELGTEQFTPSVAGNITPASQGGAVSGSRVHNEFHGPVTMGSKRDAERFAHTLAHRLRFGG